MDLRQIRDVYIDDGLDFQNATARACRDVVLTLISASRMADCILQFFRCDVPQSVGVPFHKLSVCACMWNRCGRGA